MLKFISIFVFFLLVSCADKKPEIETKEEPAMSRMTAKIDSNFKIVPGISIGNISIGRDAQSLDSILGPPDLSDSAMGKAWLTWFNKTDLIDGKHRLDIFTKYKNSDMESKVVALIRVTSPEFKTSNGIFTGQPFDSIQRLYPKMKMVATYVNPTSSSVVQIHDAADDGITFEMENSVCISIIIHEKKKNVLDDYVTFHPEMIRE